LKIFRHHLSSKKYNYEAGFEYCELNKPLFDEAGQIEDTCDFNQFATYIYFTETQTNIDPVKISGNYIGEYTETEDWDPYGSPGNVECRNLTFSFIPSYQFRHAPGDGSWESGPRPHDASRP